MKCSNPNCDKEVRAEWAVCPFCQTPVAKKKKCLSCGENLEPGWVVCPFCQAPVEKASPPGTQKAGLGDFCQGCGTLLKDKAFKCEACRGIFCPDCRVVHPDGKILPFCESCGHELVEPVRKKREQEALEKQQEEEARKAAEARRIEEEKRRKAEKEQREKEEARRRKEKEKKSREDRKKSLGIIPDPLGRPIEWYVGPDQNITWDDAKRYAENLTADGGGWRLPSLKELKGLYKKGEGKHNMSPDFGTFSCGTPVIWSGEVKDSSSAWDFYFGDGREGWYDRDGSVNGRVFAVRSRG